MQSFDAIVVGAGPAGYLCAEELAKAKMKVALVEREEVGGICLNRGCIPSKAILSASEIISKLKSFKRFRFPQIDLLEPDAVLALRKNAVNLTVRGLESRLKELGVSIIKGEAQAYDKGLLQVKTQGAVETLSFKNLIIAVGSRSNCLPDIGFDDRFVINPETFLIQDRLPKSIVIVGAGNIGVELATAATAWGAKVSLIEIMPQILTGISADVVKPVKDELERSGIKIYLESKVQKVERKEEGVEIVFVRGRKELAVEAEQVIVAIGRRPNTDQAWIKDIGLKLDSKNFIEVDSCGATNVDGVFAMGDCVNGYMLAHRAYADALRTSFFIAHQKRLAIPKAIPRVIFTRPEIAVVGLSEDEALSLGKSVYVKKYPFAGLGKANATGERTGFIRLIIDVERGSILGAEIVGAHASELAGIAGVLVECEITIDQLSRTVFAHPTFSEIFWEAAKI